MCSRLDIVRKSSTLGDARSGIHPDMNIAIKVALALVLVWVVAAAGIYFVRSAKPSPEKIVAYIVEHPIAGRPEARRMEIVEDVASDLDRMNFEQRQQLRRSPELRGFVASLSREEQARFLDLTLPEGFRQMMQAFNDMSSERRQRLIRRAIDDIERAEDEGRIPRAREFDEALTQKIVAQGLEAFYSEANAEVKLEMAPLIERMQHSLQRLR